MSARSSSPPRVGIVMAGGSGERFWPLSTSKTPKQLLNLTHPTKSMLQEAVERLDGAVEHVFVSTSRLLAEPIGQSGWVAPQNVLAEPSKRNTLGALVWVAAELIARNLGDALVAVVTADHYVGQVPRFRSAIKFALDWAQESQSIVTFGITPTRPETGYGYIEVAEEREGANEEWGAYRSVAFREKPDFATAQTYFSSGRHLWNSGMFFYSVPGFQKELRAAQPEAAEALDGIAEALKAGNHALAAQLFERVPNLSIDYAVMEKAERVYTVPVDFPWDDVGAWDALERSEEGTKDGNATRGEPILVDVVNSIVVQGDPSITVGLLGVEDLIVVSTAHAVMVCHKSHAQRVRELSRLAAEKSAGS